ncbi:ATPase, T2SS/T4P/T4SS family, partial [Mesorhizobium sp. M4B.F.Ca.ET.017.02.2.1]|uniref:ATPase, T2SS/T4P/T4SS family n=1 Tax=Mesorhizobium sp. M4B.F.Ca.ET.017.02.2.1 TaxID=2496649 RepID=UPI000FD3B4C2
MLGRFIKGPSEPGLLQPVSASPKSTGAQTAAPPVEAEAYDDNFLSLKVDLHRHLIDRFNLTALESASKDEILNEIRPIVREFVRSRNVPLNARELDQLTGDTADEMLGLGPIEPLLKDDSITDILINTHKRVFIERRGVIEETAIRFRDEAHLLRIINKIVSAIGRRVDESAPMVDARLDDGSRVNIAVRPISVDGPLVSIRKFSKNPYSLDRLVVLNSI